MASLDAYPIAVQVENRSRLPLPFEVGSYRVPRGPKEGANTVYIEESNAKVQTVLVCFPRVTYQPDRAPQFKVHKASAEWFYNDILRMKSDFKTSQNSRYGSTRHEEVTGNNERKVTREIPYIEDVAAYELAVETINDLLLASKCAIKGLSNYPRFDDDYFSALYHQDSWFYHYVPEFSAANRIHKRRFPMAIGLPSGFLVVTEEDYESSVLPILQNKTAYGIDEMIVSANKSFGDGEYEASLVILEAIFEAKVKGCIRRYYASLPSKSERERKQRIGDAIGNKPITRLLVEEYPKCEDFQRFCEGVPAYDKWNRIYKMRNDFSHELQRLVKGKAVKMFKEFDEVCQYLFGLKTNYR